MKTKIIATLGPASNTEEIISELINSGVNLFRFNFSHGSYEEHLEKFKLVKKIAKEKGVFIGTIADLQGPKIRLGKLSGGKFEIATDSEILMKNMDSTENNSFLPIPYNRLFEKATVGEKIMINDGLIQLSITEILDSSTIKCKIVAGGTVSDHKGVNLPDTKLNSSSLTKKDYEDLEFIKKYDFDYVALSFVQSHENVIELKKLLKESKFKIDVISKIEKKEAIDDIDNIIKESDGIMVARGDLGIEVPIEILPQLQKMIIKKCKQFCKPVITATQVMESMVNNPIPTRAEVTDIYNAILDGTDALMLSAETAAGKYPIKTVKAMRKVANNSDKMVKKFTPDFSKTSLSTDHTIAMSACLCAREANAKYIIATTMSGKTARLVSKNRPNCYIIAMSPNYKALQKSSLFWGVKSILCKEIDNTDDLIKESENIIIENSLSQKGDKLILTGGLPFHVRGITNFVKIITI